MNLFKIRQKNNIIIWILILCMVFVQIPYTVKAAATDIEFVNIDIDEITDNSVKIIWDTNINTYGKVRFGESQDNLVYYIGDAGAATRYHEAELANLKGDTTYYYQIEASNSYETNKTFIYSVKTEKTDDVTAPVVKSLKVEYVGTTVAVLTWSTDEKSTTRVEYSIDKSYKSKAGASAMTTSHQIVLKNLSPYTKYYVRAFSIDKDGNSSGYLYKEFRTTLDKNIDTRDLNVSNLRPNSLGDSNIGVDTLTVMFRVDRWAKGTVRLKTKGEKDRVMTLDQAIDHEAVFIGLTPGKDYNVIINMVDIFNKKYTTGFNVTTRTVANTTSNTASAPIAGNTVVTATENSVISQATRSISSCESEYLTKVGFYGDYFNLTKSTPLVNELKPVQVAKQTGWYDQKYHSFSRVDDNLDFGDKFFPIDEGLPGDPFYFSVYWRAIVLVPESGSYEFFLASDDDTIMYVDKQLKIDMWGKHKPTKQRKLADLDKGYHLVEIYYAERGPANALLRFDLDSRLEFYPWPAECGDNLDFKGNNNSYNNGNNGSDEVIVAGIEYSYYTPASALYRTPESPDVYAIVNGQRHYISSPASFNKYGYKWEDIRVISKSELEKYPRARLLRTPDDPTIHFLYQRPENQWLKIDLNSPTVFISYSANYWGNVIKVTEEDIESYPNVKFIRNENSKDIYYLDASVKRPISDELFTERGYNPYHIVTVNPVHFESYRTESPVQ